MKEFRQVSAYGGMQKAVKCHHNPTGAPNPKSMTRGCAGCDGSAYVLASDAYKEINRLKALTHSA